MGGMPGERPPLRIALLGTRGVPASYSGFETCAEELGGRLAARGHAVTVYCRVPHVSYAGRTYKGMRLVKLPTIRSKHFDTIAHGLLSSLHALGRRYDVDRRRLRRPEGSRGPRCQPARSRSLVSDVAGGT